MKAKTKKEILAELKQLESLEKFRKRAKAREEKFLKMSAARKRVAIAKDALKQLEEDTIFPRTGLWFETTLDVPELVGDDTSFREALFLANGRISCSACALGAIFCSLVKLDSSLENNLRLSCGVNNYGDRVLDVDLPQRSHPNSFIGEYFSENQIQLIELCYELGAGWCAALDDEEKKIVNAWSEYKTNRCRMKAIMENIIKNNGEFKPKLDKHYKKLYS